jgi:hypothetical protein
LRGYFVVVMTINHLRMWPAWTLPFTGGGRLWFTAAEGFILVSGIVFGYLYRSRIVARGWHKVLTVVAKRALKLYLLAVAGQILFTTGDFILRAWRGRPSDIPAEYWKVVESAVLQIRFSYPYLDILVLYALLLLWGLFAIYLLAQNRWKLVLFGSFLLWYAWRRDPASFSIFFAYFKFAIWQFLFILGIIGGYYRPELRQWWQNLPFPVWLRTLVLAAPALLILGFSYQVVFHGWQIPEFSLIVIREIGYKASLPLSRIFFSLWVFAALYGLVSWLWRPLNKLFGWLFLLLGQNALLAYLLHGLLTYIIHRLPGYPFASLGPVVTGFVHIGVVLLLWVLVRHVYAPFQAWMRR